jgi:hypothetical protein
MKLIFQILLFSSIFALHVSAQKTEENSDARKYYFGGNLGLALGDVTMVEFSPHVGYYFTPNLTAGIGGKYHFYKERNRIVEGIKANSSSTNIYGFNMFAEYDVVKSMAFLDKSWKNAGFFFHFESEVLNLDHNFFQEDKQSGRFWTNNNFIGLGFKQWISPHANLYLMLLYNFNYQADLSPYNDNPSLRIGFNF